MRDDAQGCCNNKTFEGVIKDLLSEEVLVIIKSGGPGIPIFDDLDLDSKCGDRCLPGCCAHQGRLCTIGKDFIQLLSDDAEIIIPFNAIAAVVELDD